MVGINSGRYGDSGVKKKEEEGEKGKSKGREGKKEKNRRIVL